jgi:hypothetical protein
MPRLYYALALLAACLGGVLCGRVSGALAAPGDLLVDNHTGASSNYGRKYYGQSFTAQDGWIFGGVKMSTGSTVTQDFPVYLCAGAPTGDTGVEAYAAACEASSLSSGTWHHVQYADNELTDMVDYALSSGTYTFVTWTSASFFLLKTNNGYAGGRLWACDAGQADCTDDTLDADFSVVEGAAGYPVSATVTGLTLTPASVAWGGTVHVEATVTGNDELITRVQVKVDGETVSAHDCAGPSYCTEYAVDEDVDAGALGGHEVMVDVDVLEGEGTWAADTFTTFSMHGSETPPHVTDWYLRGTARPVAYPTSQLPLRALTDLQIPESVFAWPVAYRVEAAVQFGGSIWPATYAGHDWAYALEPSWGESAVYADDESWSVASLAAAGRGLAVCTGDASESCFQADAPGFTMPATAAGYYRLTYRGCFDDGTCEDPAAWFYFYVDADPLAFVLPDETAAPDDTDPILGRVAKFIKDNFAPDLAYLAHGMGALAIQSWLGGGDGLIGTYVGAVTAAPQRSGLSFTVPASLPGLPAHGQTFRLTSEGGDPIVSLESDVGAFLAAVLWFLLARRMVADVFRRFGLGSPEGQDSSPKIP